METPSKYEEAVMKATKLPGPGGSSVACQMAQRQK